MALTLAEKTRLCAVAADSRKALHLVGLNVHDLSSIADHFLICSGTSDRHVKAIADAIEEQLEEQGEKPLAIEGYQKGAWILLDCADLIVHIFDEDTRRFYDLERLWGRAERLALEEMGVEPALPEPLHGSFVEQ